MNQTLDKSSTRERIIWCGLQLLSQQGLAGITLGRLATLAGMSKSGLFAHFGSKEEVAFALLERAAQLAQVEVVASAFEAAEGLPRLRQLVINWLGWSQRAGLPGGCPMAAAMFELDDSPGPLRERVLELQLQWQTLLTQLLEKAIKLGHLNQELDSAQFIWELGGIYLAHHASLRFMQDAQADLRARRAFDDLLQRSRTTNE